MPALADPQPRRRVPRLPVPHFNVVNGGVHAPNDLDFQEFMIAPIGAPTIAEAVRAGAEVYAALKSLLSSKGRPPGLATKGALPRDRRPEEVLALLVEPSRKPATGRVATGWRWPWILHRASSTGTGTYHVAGEALSSDDMIERYADIVGRYPVWLIEDGLAESDWDGWERLTARLGERVELVGDDILCTNPAIISEAIARKAGNASLIKVNQIGTVTETLEAMRVCRQAGWAQFVSHRSGETEDTFIADLAVGTGCGHLKPARLLEASGSSKYNRLIEIDAAESMPYGLAE